MISRFNTGDCDRSVAFSKALESEWNRSGCLKLCAYSSWIHSLRQRHQATAERFYLKFFKWTTFNAALENVIQNYSKGDGFLWQYRNVFHQIIFKLVAPLVYFDWKHFESPYHCYVSLHYTLKCSLVRTLGFFSWKCLAWMENCVCWVTIVDDKPYAWVARGVCQ